MTKPEAEYSFDSYTPRRTSFCLVTKNRASYLKKALGNLKPLVEPHDELIVIDGASVDATRDVVRSYGDFINIFVSEPDIHGPHAINKAILLARGKYIKFLTDDDVYHPEGISAAIEIMEKHPDIDLLLTGGTKEAKGKVWNYCVPAGVNFGKNPEDIFRYKGATGVGHFIRRSALARLCLLYPSRMNADAALVLEAMKRGGIVKFCRINTFHHVIHEHSTITTRDKEHTADTKSLVREYCSRWFYFYYCMNQILKPFTRMLYRTFYFFKNTRGWAPTASTKMVWDGGFS